MPWNAPWHRLPRRMVASAWPARPGSCRLRIAGEARSADLRPRQLVAPLPAPDALGVVLERQGNPRAVGDDLAAFDLHVELADLGDAQIAQGLRCGFDSAL